MKKLLLFSVLFLFTINTFSQTIEFIEVTAATTTGGINVNVKAVSYNGADYLSYSYAIDGNTINLDVCYSFNMTLPVLFFENNFFIPLPNSGNYTLNVYAKNSESPTVCDNFSTSDTETIIVSYLSNEEFQKSKTQISPNPFSNNFDIETNETIVNYTLYDVAGKLLISSTSKNELDNLTPKLNQGIYFLNLQFENGEKSTYKIVKK